MISRAAIKKTKGKYVRYIFTHMPKTAGSSLREALAEKLPRSNIFYDYNNPLSDAPTKRHLKCIANSIKYGLRNAAGAQGNDSLIYGHFLMGKYARFNGRNFSQYDNHVYITFMRDPLQRAVSHYQYWMRKDCSSNKAWRMVVNDNWTLEQFLLSDYFSNFQSKFLYRFPSEAVSFIGISEQYERCIDLLGSRFPLFSGLQVKQVNTNPDKVEPYEVGNEIRRKFMELNAADYDNYDKALQRLSIA